MKFDCRARFRNLLLVTCLFVPSLVPADESEMNPFNLYREAVASLETAQTFSVHVEKQYDVIMLDGAKIQYSGAMDMLVRREGALHIDYGDDVSAKEAWYDGSVLTLVDHLNNVYAQVPAEGRVRNMVVDLNERYALDLPLAPLLSLRIAGEFESSVQSTTYLGLHDADGEPCHHVLYRGKNIDLQVWFTTGKERLVRKLVATFWRIEGEPQQTLVFSDWNLKARTGRRSFQAKIPDGAVRTDILPAGGERK